MDTLHVLLALMALAAATAAVGLALARGRALASTAAARASLEHADVQQARLAAEVQTHTQRAADLDTRHRALELQHARAETELEAILAQHASDLAKAQEIYQAQLRGLEQRERELQARLAELKKEATDTFKALAGDALKSSIADLIKYNDQARSAEHARATGELEQRKTAVEHLVKPIGESLASLAVRVQTITEAAGNLGRRTEQLREALSKPHVRGRYGEIQLQRVVEVAGMKTYCDVTTQESIRDDDGRTLRPDMTVRLPNDRIIVIDSKATTGAYMEAVEAGSAEEAEACLQRFASQVADQVSKLAAKSYWDQFEKSPEFVVMFIPGDQFIDAALQRHPGLFELAAQKRIILASPSTLLGLLRAVQMGWKEQRLSEQAEELRREGAKLYDRARTCFEHIHELGRSLERSIKNYNSFAGAYQNSLEPTLRKFEELGKKSDEKQLPEIAEITITTRHLITPDKTPD